MGPPAATGEENDTETTASEDTEVAPDAGTVALTANGGRCWDAGVAAGVGFPTGVGVAGPHGHGRGRAHQGHGHDHDGGQQRT